METNREKLINLGIITPASYFESLPEGHPKRHAYEMKLILIGDDYGNRSGGSALVVAANGVKSTKGKIVINPKVAQLKVEVSTI